MAQIRRPDLIELKLILEADQQRLIFARNQRQPSLDLVGLYRWNGLDGTTPEQTRITTQGGESTDWTVGVNFSVPLFMRAERAGVRSAELLITRDRATLEQGVQTARQILANNFRNLDQFYMQYEAFTISREAAKDNLERQFAVYEHGIDVIFLNVLQAISDWGNSVSLQAQSLTQYNIELANLERQTGTILETHAVFLYEDRFCSLGPLWIDPKRCTALSARYCTRTECGHLSCRQRAVGAVLRPERLSAAFVVARRTATVSAAAGHSRGAAPRGRGRAANSRNAAAAHTASVGPGRSSRVSRHAASIVSRRVTRTAAPRSDRAGSP